MKHSAALVALCVALGVAVAQAQSTAAPVALYPNFPFCQCIRSPSPYSIDQTVKAFGNGTYCFTLNVKQPAWNATGYCAARADIKKIEFNVYKECDVFGPVVNATVNGVPTRVGPAFDKAEQGPVDARILRFTQLNLGLQSDGTSFCITLGKNTNGKGCTSLEELCVPPAGAPPGACSMALFDSKQDCCPISRVNVPSPPPAPLSPPPPPPPPPANETCETCAYLTLEPRNGPPPFPVIITQEQCNDYGALVYADLVAKAEAAGAAIIPGTETVTCGDNVVKMCATFGSNNDGLKLNGNELAAAWLDFIVPSGGCPAWLNGYTARVVIAGDGDAAFPPVSSCLNGEAAIPCAPRDVPFPKCFCDTRQKTTRFAALPILEELPGVNNKTNSTLYCFTLKNLEPTYPNSPCGKTTILHKAEMWGNDAPTQRRKILSIGIQPAGGSMYFISPSWGKKDEQTLKASPLNWTPEQADGAKICMELSKATDLNTFCIGGANTCWINFFSVDKSCCPLYSASLV